jgi:hypothetical protein
MLNLESSRSSVGLDRDDEDRCSSSTDRLITLQMTLTVESARLTHTGSF